MGSFFFFFSSRRRHTRCGRDWSSDVCSSDLRFAKAKRPEDEDGTVPVALAEAQGGGIEIAMSRGLQQPQRIEIGFEMAADAVGADQQPGALRVPGGGPDLLFCLASEGGGNGGAVTLDVAVGGRGQAVGIDGADDMRAVGRPGGAAHFGQHAFFVLAQRLEESAPLGVNRSGITEIARIEFLDEWRIGAEQERCLLRSHGQPLVYSSPPSSSSPPLGEKRPGEGIRYG